MSQKNRGTTRRLIVKFLTDQHDAGRFAAPTVTDYRQILNQFADTAPYRADAISRRTIVAWLGHQNHLSVNTRRHRWHCVRTFCDWLRGHGVIKHDPFRDLTKPKETRPVHRSLDHDQIAALLDACLDTRETVIVMLGVHTGLRRAELAGLEVGDVSLSHRTITVRHGKGGHSRMLPLSEEACLAVSRHLAASNAMEGPVISSQKRRGPIQPATLGKIMRSIAERAGVKLRAWDGVGTHSLRHTAATDVYRGSHDVLAVRDMLGHVSLATTERYVRSLDVERLRDAVEGRHYAA